MNEVLKLKGSFEHHSNSSKPGPAKLPAGSEVSVGKLQKLIDNLNYMLKYWNNNQLIPEMLISAYYIKIAAKSNRILGFFSKKGLPNSKVVGAKFGLDTSNEKRHIITYKVSREDVKDSINNVSIALEVLNKLFGGEITDETFNELNNDEIYKQYEISKSKLKQIIVDSWFVERFGVEETRLDSNDSQIITIYDTGVDIIQLMNSIGLNVSDDRLLDKNTIRLYGNEMAILDQKAPYLVAMSTDDLSEYSTDDFINNSIPSNLDIEKPNKEPVIGVIDTVFDKKVYFGDWVDYVDLVDSNLTHGPKDYSHGTYVDSIIVDGPSLNPDLDDGCGRFRVKHFGVSLSGKTSSFIIINLIKEAVRNNPEIKVWNISLGSQNEVNQNFISVEAAVLDKLQAEYNILFVISATNKEENDPRQKRIGAPADSINSVVVGSVNKQGKQASYSRKGGVLSFFIKPDVSYYGGDIGEYLNVADSNGIYEVCGTSFAAPWITRKLAYLIEKMGLSREVAKALLIDSACGWHDLPTNYHYVGNGIVPQRIEDILKTDNDEIKMVIRGMSDKWNTYTYNLPVPTDEDGKYPFFARATLCYFSDCSRAQGVDYTNTELDLYFGRVNSKDTIDSINKNHQSDNTVIHVKEKDARNNFRKWDTVKHIYQEIKSTAHSKKYYHGKMWGISVKSKNRLSTSISKDTPFGIVITFKEMNGKNRIEDFIQQASLRGWIVSRINIQEQLEVYNQAEEDINWK